MPRLTLHILVPATPEQVYEYITNYPGRGEPDEQSLQERYGELVEHMGNIYRFQEADEDRTIWQIGFEPPHSRTMRAIDSNWSDRLDDFEAVPEGTRWTITWETKTRGLPSYTQWLAFHLRGKARIYQQVMVPVAAHFQESQPTHRPDSKSNDQTGYY
jgi:hypothetical protein